MNGNNLVIGIGNEFRGDDALGVEVVRRLVDKHPGLADYHIEQDDPTRLIDLWKDKNVVIIDAVRTGELDRGALYLVHSMDELLLADKKFYSTHALGLKQILELGKYLQRLPNSFFFIGVKGERWGVGDVMSDHVFRSCDRVVAAVLEHLELN